MKIFLKKKPLSKMSGSVVQGIDTLTAAMKSNIVPDQEYLLQGSILDTHLDVLQHRLRGLCDGGEEMVWPYVVYIS